MIADADAVVDGERLEGWLDDHAVGSGHISDVTVLAGGTQNVLIRFRRAGRVYVLRRPPIRPRPGAHDVIARETRVLAALASSDVPHARLIAACDDPDVIGAAFYLMEHVAGASPTDRLPQPYLDDPEWRRRLGVDVIDAAAAIASLDHVAAGLDGFGKPDGFLERQVPQWRARLDGYLAHAGYPGAHLPGLAEVSRWLAADVPPAGAPALIHGDFHLANVIAAPDRPGVAAIVDWELATIGDPLVDLGWLLATWPDENGTTPTGRHVRPVDGYPARADLVARYREQTSRDLAAVAWFEVLACYKLGILLEGTYARSCAGLAERDVGQRLHIAAVNLFDHARVRLRADRR